VTLPTGGRQADPRKVRYARVDWSAQGQPQGTQGRPCQNLVSAELWVPRVACTVSYLLLPLEPHKAVRQKGEPDSEEEERESCSRLHLVALRLASSLAAVGNLRCVSCHMC